MPAGPDRAIFIIGIEHRSGTNFLNDLLALHEDCCRPTTIGEDFLLHNADHLRRYAAALHQSWNPDWRASAPVADIGAALGRGLLSILEAQADRSAPRILTKTPRADRLGLFPWLFPDHPLLIIVRDGRSLVESAVRSFGWTYGKAIERWARGARRILEFDRDQRDGSCRYLIVRYEDLVTGLESELRRILAFLRLDPAGYDFAAAAALPVRGSSMLKTEGKQLHWTPVNKSKDFRPLERASNWTARQNRTFLRQAGHLQELLGYSLAGIPQSGLLDRLLARVNELRWRRKIAKLGLRPLERQVVEMPGEETGVLPFRRAA
ncbi:MAG: sulfotransferase [Planctomycetaceae bacterium]|nr:sulfotransferase [Planctomycetaceae bacterium]